MEPNIIKTLLGYAIASPNLPFLNFGICILHKFSQQLLDIEPVNDNQRYEIILIQQPQ